MGESLLIKTAKNLLPLGIHLRHSNVSTHEDFNCHTFEKVELDVQFKSGPGSEYKAMLDEKNHEGIILFLFEAAVRLIDPSVNEDDDGFVKAEISAFFEAEYELLLTQKLILQPRFEMDWYGKNDNERGIGSGASSTAFGIRLRYEIRRQIAPYIGVEWTQQYGDTKDFTRAAGGDPSETRFVAGLRFWF